MVFLRLIAGVGAVVVVVGVVVVKVFIDMVLSLTVGFDGFVTAVVVVVVVAMVVVVIAGIIPDAVDVDVLLMIKFFRLFSGFEAIETVTSLKRFKWKSNCASAVIKIGPSVLKYDLMVQKMNMSSSKILSLPTHVFNQSSRYHPKHS